MKGKHKDLRGALTAARKYWTGPSQRAKVTDWKRGLDWLSNTLGKRTEKGPIAGYMRLKGAVRK